jgi:hypothetical protein
MSSYPAKSSKSSERTPEKEQRPANQQMMVLGVGNIRGDEFFAMSFKQQLKAANDGNKKAAIAFQSNLDSKLKDIEGKAGPNPDYQAWSTMTLAKKEAVKETKENFARYMNGPKETETERKNKWRNKKEMEEQKELMEQGIQMIDSGEVKPITSYFGVVQSKSNNNKKTAGAASSKKNKKKTVSKKKASSSKNKYKY